VKRNNSLTESTENAESLFDRINRIIKTGILEHWNKEIMGRRRHPTREKSRIINRAFPGRTLKGRCMKSAFADFLEGKSFSEKW
jgi:hypothetical protein